MKAKITKSYKFEIQVKMKVKGIWLACPKVHQGKGWCQFPANYSADILQRMQLSVDDYTLLLGMRDPSLESNKRDVEMWMLQFDIWKQIGWLQGYEWLCTSLCVLQPTTGHVEYTLECMRATVGGWYSYRVSNLYREA